jgi:rhamnosyltransferase
MNKLAAVILTYKPDEKLNIIITRLKAQTVQPDKILIMNTVEDGEADTEAEWAEDLGDVTVVNVEKSEFDHGGTRDFAMQLCEDFEYVLFMTQDAVPKNRKLTENLMRPLEADKTSHAVAYAKQEPEKHCNIIERYTRGFNYSDEPHSGLEMAAQTNNSIKSIFCSDAGAMYNRSLYDEVGGFPAKAIFNEDMVYAGKALKADKDVMYEPSAVVIHSHNYTGVQYFKRYFDLGVSHADFAYILKDYHTNDEGIKLVRATAKFLIRRKEYIMLIPLLYHSGCKFIGMKLGKQYKKLPKKMIEKCTTNKEYWEKDRK